MNCFSKIYSFFLAFAVVFTTFSQMQTSLGLDRVLAHSEETETPAYSSIYSQNIWGVINLDSNSSLFNIYSSSDSEEDRKSSAKTLAERESALTKISSLYLLFSRNITVSPSVSDLIYPSHFYF